MREFKDILLELRKNRNITQDELSNSLHITKQALSHYERGTRYPKKETLEAIADYFNVDMNFLTGRSATTTIISTPAAAPSLPPDQASILAKYGKLSSTGKDDLHKRADELIALGYTEEEEIKKKEEA